MKKINITLAGLLMANQAWSLNLPTCEEARVSASAKLSTMTLILNESLKLAEKADSLEANAKIIYSEYQAGLISKADATSKLQKIKSDAMDLKIDLEQLRQLEDCVGN